jgi:asparagine synthase (glutamine-hydrolysing)
VGFLLSGGVDSTAMLSFASRGNNRPLASFTLGFSKPGITDERPYARLAAARYGSEHHEMTVSAQDFVDFLPKYVWHMEEPVCEPPAIAFYYVSRLAKDFVKVLISGEGGDEAFGGYQNYRSTLWLERLKTIFKPFNGAISAGLSRFNNLFPTERVTKYGPLFGCAFDSYYYSRTSSPFTYFNSHAQELYSADFAQLVDSERSLSVATRNLEKTAGADLINRMLYVDTKTWLPDDLLIKADKMTMANSIELRVPLLDHKVLEFAASLPGNFKVRGLTTKYILKKALKNQVPREILNRRKAGFPVPYATWMRTDLKDWFHGILLDRETLNRGYFQKKTIEKLLAEDLRTGRYSKEVFSLAVLELWHRTFVGKNKSHSSDVGLEPAPTVTGD